MRTVAATDHNNLIISTFHLAGQRNPLLMEASYFAASHDPIRHWHVLALSVVITSVTSKIWL